jgi:hypothetical protein
MGFVNNPTPASSLQSINSLGYAHQMVAGGSGGPSGCFQSGWGPSMLTGVAGTVNTTLATSGTPMSTCRGRTELNEACSLTTTPVGWSSQGLFENQSPWFVSATAKAGGFYVEIYAGIGDTYNATSQPAYFIGLCSIKASVNNFNPPPLSSNNSAMVDAIGLICNSSGASHSTTWSTITRRGTGVAVVSSLGIALAAGQLFCVRFVYPAGSDAGLMSIKQLTAPGVWTAVTTNLALTGVGPATGTQLYPSIGFQPVVSDAGTSSIAVHRIFSYADAFSVPPAFPS